MIRKEKIELLEFTLGDGPGEWEAESRLCYEPGDQMYWRIDITDDGLFSIDNSALELLPEGWRPPDRKGGWKLFETFKAAEAFCRRLERKMVRDFDAKEKAKQ